MLINHFLENQKKRLQKNSDFYTSRGIHVYFKDKIANEIDVESVMAKIESKLPAHMLSEIEMIVIGWFDEFEEREVNAFYDSGAVYVSNIQNSDEDLFDDIVHEISHSVEEALLLGERLYVMAPRPGRIHKEYNLPFASMGLKEDLREIKNLKDFTSKREEILTMIWNMEEEIMGKEL